jgi:glutathione S-transferase
MLTLYFTPGASSMAPHIAPHEIGVPFESHHISLAKKETRTPAYLAINPEGKVPTLLIGGRLLTEVAGILFYLAKRYPEANLLPAGDIEAEAQAVSWMSFIAATVHPARSRGLDYAMGIYKLVNQRLGEREWALDRCSIADIHLFRLFWRFTNSLKPPAGSLPTSKRTMRA